MNRRFLLQVPLIAATLFDSTYAEAQGSMIQPDVSCKQLPDWGKVAGDEGYNHHMFHDSYKRIFMGEYACRCGVGECRQTIFRETQLGATHGFDVYVNRVWYPINKYWRSAASMRSGGTKLVDGRTLKDFAPELMEVNVAHVCAYTQGEGYCKSMRIECAIINAVRV